MSETTAEKVLAPGPDQSYSFDINITTQQIISDLLDQYGDIIKINDAKRPQPIYVITNPDSVKHVLVSNHSNYLKGTGFERVKMLLGNGIIVSDGDFWRRQRTMIQPAFSRKNIIMLTEMMKTVCHRLIERWGEKADNNESIDITLETSEFGLEVILRALLSDDFDGLIAEHGANPFAFLTDDPTRDLAVAMRFRQTGKLIQKIIDQRRDKNSHAGDLLDNLMQATDKSGAHMSDKELIDEVMTMIIAGHETTGGTLNWVWHELSQHPEAEQKVFQEISAQVSGNNISDQKLAELRYTKQCIDETLRLYPPVWLYSRKAINDDVLQGYHVPAGSNIFLSPYFTQRDSRLWEKPNEFYPEHFRNEGAELNHKFAFFPFSAGSRRCVGEYFSYIEMQIHISLLINQFKLTTLPGQTIEIDPAINLRTKNSIMMQVTRRT